VVTNTNNVVAVSYKGWYESEFYPSPQGCAPFSFHKTIHGWVSSWIRSNKTKAVLFKAISAEYFMVITLHLSRQSNSSNMTKALDSPPASVNPSETVIGTKEADFRLVCYFLNKF